MGPVPGRRWQEDQETRNENKPPKEPGAIISEMGCPREIPEVCGVVFEKAQKQLPQR